MIKMHASVTCDHCGFEVEMQGDYRPGVESHKIPPGWESELWHGMSCHYCPACKTIRKPFRQMEETP